MPIIKFLNKSRDSKKISKYSRRVLIDIMKTSGVRYILITSTARTAHEQGRIMYENIERHGVSHQKQLYGPFGDKVIDEYFTLKQKGISRQDIILRMTSKINILGPRKISRHAGNPKKLNVIDIAPSSIRLTVRKKFKLTIRRDNRVSKSLTPPKDPAYHLEIPQP